MRLMYSHVDSEQRSKEVADIRDCVRTLREKAICYLRGPTTFGYWGQKVPLSDSKPHNFDSPLELFVLPRNLSTTILSSDEFGTS